MKIILEIYIKIIILKFVCTNLEEKVGRIAQLDELIYDPYILKAIAFSVNSKDLVYQQILEELIERIDLKKSMFKDKISQKNFEYYVYILENVRKYTSKWLTEEINHLIDKSYAKPDDMNIISKKNIANFVYHTAAEYAIDLVLNGQDTSMAGWKAKKKLNKDEL